MYAPWYLPGAASRAAPIWCRSAAHPDVIKCWPADAKDAQPLPRKAVPDLLARVLRHGAQRLDGSCRRRLRQVRARRHHLREFVSHYREITPNGNSPTCSGLLTWGEIRREVVSSKSLGPSLSRHIPEVTGLKVVALHNYLASIFTTSGRQSRKRVQQVRRSATFRPCL